MADPDRIRGVKDPLVRARRAHEAYAETSEVARELSAIRRRAFAELHDRGMTWSEIGAAMGMRPGTVEKVAANRTAGTSRWWQRVPGPVAESAKLGARGLRRDEQFSSAETLQAIRSVLTARGRRRRGVAMGPTEMLPEVSSRLGRQVPMASLRVAIRRGVDSGELVRVARGRYQAGPEQRPRQMS
jgi:hypothetical protein